MLNSTVLYNVWWKKVDRGNWLLLCRGKQQERSVPQIVELAGKLRVTAAGSNWAVVLSGPQVIAEGNSSVGLLELQLAALSSCWAQEGPGEELGARLPRGEEVVKGTGGSWVGEELEKSEESRQPNGKESEVKGRSWSSDCMVVTMTNSNARCLLAAFGPRSEHWGILESILKSTMNNFICGSHQSCGQEVRLLPVIAAT